jgi:hypothetical protein
LIIGSIVSREIEVPIGVKRGTSFALIRFLSFGGTHAARDDGLSTQI